MHQPSPWILLIGGGALLNVGVMVGGLKAPAWARYSGMALCMAMGLTCLVLALLRYFQKKPERAKFQPRRARPVELAPETLAQRSAARKKPPRDEPPPDAA